VPNLRKKTLINWIVWFILVIIWNYGYPLASPLEDVLVALILSVVLIFLNRINY